MANTIRIKRKTTSGIPLAEDVEIGELVHVLPDKKIVVKNTDDSFIELTTINITSGTNPPTGGNDGDIYLQYT